MKLSLESCYIASQELTIAQQLETRELIKVWNQLVGPLVELLIHVKVGYASVKMSSIVGVLSVGPELVTTRLPCWWWRLSRWQLWT
jgi:hypothetical protein